MKLPQNNVLKSNPGNFSQPISLSEIVGMPNCLIKYMQLKNQSK